MIIPSVTIINEHPWKFETSLQESKITNSTRDKTIKISHFLHCNRDHIRSIMIPMYTLCVCKLSSPISRQEAKTGWTDFVIEYNHGQDPTGGRGTALNGNVPPFLFPTGVQWIVAHQGQGYILVPFSIP